MLYCMNCKRDTETSPCEHCGGEKTATVYKLSGDVSDVTVTLNPEPKSDDKRTFQLPTFPEFSMKIQLTPEEAEKLSQMLPKFDVSQFVGLPCATCGEPFTQAFFDDGGGIIRTADDRWQHDHCSSQN